MLIYYPSLIASAILFASVIINFRDKNYGLALTTSLFSIPLILLLVFLSQKNLDIVAYILLLVPIISIYIGYNSGIKKLITTNQQKNQKNQPNQPNQPTTPDRIEPSQGTAGCAMCNKAPCRCPVKIKA